jgi:WD40 repeat protein
MMLTEQDSKVLIVNEDQSDNNIYYMDLEKGKIISELSGKNIDGINDISTFEKNSDMTVNPLFFGCHSKNIFQMDPRVKESVVMERPYATNYQFQTITAANGGSFAVGSEDGAIRLYKQCSGNAKNLLPSLLGQPILHLDTSKDGKFLLATCKSHVLLIPTFQDNKSGFDTTFRKDDKPRPVILKITPAALAKHGIKDVAYSYAMFDNKSSKESYIAAVSGSHLILWDLSKVLKGKYDTAQVKSLGDRIVQNQFKYNTDKLVAALPQKLICQDTKISKR